MRRKRALIKVNTNMVKLRSNFEEKREFLRLEYRHPFDYKVCKEETISNLLSGYSKNISQAGLLCNLHDRVPLNSTLWLRLDLAALHLCEEIERRSVILQNGILGKVVWQRKQDDGSYDIGVRFLTKRERFGDNNDRWIKRF